MKSSRAFHLGKRLNFNWWSEQHREFMKAWKEYKQKAFIAEAEFNFPPDHVGKTDIVHEEEHFKVEVNFCNSGLEIIIWTKRTYKGKQRRTFNIAHIPLEYLRDFREKFESAYFLHDHEGKWKYRNEKEPSVKKKV